MVRPSKTQKSRLLAVLGLIVLIPIGLYSKAYSGIASQWVNNSLGAVFYEMAWCFLFYSVFPTPKAVWRIPLAVFLVTCGLEFLQLWQPDWLQAIRATFLGKMILGTTFAKADFFYYVIGCGLGGVALWGSRRVK
ncbi:DUF2809 domain-containing protein [Spirulina sp. CS-785/01]|uniref:ribosomal maturation YjgA family protein n=1 Tax=Spirulina sp. CS-785/01 TaxID=3021716 RepID=UPI002330F16B|nr:DUF2809 domain-containing protein [Spirulina sp. CS-785/01]MDB9315197.1 DUF2809 domain-containing protein [Spirulina sp. CS-785/01]